MKILLVGNYPSLQSQSMDRFADMLYQGLKSAGHEVELIKPRPFIGVIRPSPEGLGKWLGYIDRFALFLPRIRATIARADIVHICDQANAIYVPLLNGKPHLVTCHDVLAIRSALGEIPQNPTSFTGRVYQQWILHGLRRAQHLVCVSEKTRSELLRLAAIPPDRASVVPNALNYPYRRMDDEEAGQRLQRLGFRADQPFLLHVGGNSWYKNRKGLLAIFSRLAEMEGFGSYRFILAGRPMTPELLAIASSASLSGRVYEIVRPTNEDLQALYSSAKALIFPSLYEGFGWPIIEAQACGCHVFTSDRPPMTQVGGDAAVYIDPDDTEGSARIIAACLAGGMDRTGEGFKNAACYSTEAFVAGYLQAYEARVQGTSKTRCPAERAIL